MQNLVGKTFTHNGIVKEVYGSEVILWSTNGPGVWFATEAQMRAALGDARFEEMNSVTES